MLSLYEQSKWIMGVLIWRFSNKEADPLPYADGRPLEVDEKHEAYKALAFLKPLI